MKKQIPLLLLLGVMLLFLSGIGWLFRMRISGGDVFPAYSSLRADPLGTRALYESLELDSQLQVQRWLRPIHQLDTSVPATIILPGMTSEFWRRIRKQDATALDAAARLGGRVVVVFAAEIEDIGLDELPRTELRRDSKRRAKEAEEKEEKRRPDRLKAANWSELWGVQLKRRHILDSGLGAQRRKDAPEDLPASVAWRSDTFFQPGAEWRVLYSRGGSPVLIERQVGKGSLVLASDAYFLSNEALQKDRSIPLLAWAMGSSRKVVFVESHLGVAEDVGIATLARRYGLSGAFVVLVLWAGLFVWRRAALFVPPPKEAAERALSYNQTAGLEALLRRSVPPAQLLPTCLAEWKEHARASDVNRVEAALAQLDSSASPAEAYNAAVAALNRRTLL